MARAFSLVTHRIGMCGYTDVSEDGRTCFIECWKYYAADRSGVKLELFLHVIV